MVYEVDIIPADANHNVVGFANEGEEIVLVKGMHMVSRISDGKELSSNQLHELYFT